MTLSSLFRRCINIEYINLANDASYAYEKIKDTLYIYFQKSNGAVDWKNNFDFPIKCHRGYYAHRGFLTLWISLEQIIDNIIKEEMPKSVVITGYSHGGALAILCHEYVYSSFPLLRSSLLGYGFGCPRVLWGFTNSIPWQGFTVIRNINDIVTHLPPFILGYHHVGHILEIGKRNTYSMIDAHREENIQNELAFYESQGSIHA